MISSAARFLKAEAQVLLGKQRFRSRRYMHQGKQLDHNRGRRCCPQLDHGLLIVDGVADRPTVVRADRKYDANARRLHIEEPLGPRLPSSASCFWGWCVVAYLGFPLLLKDLEVCRKVLLSGTRLHGTSTMRQD